jgi:hypothetical protein
LLLMALRVAPFAKIRWFQRDCRAIKTSSGCVGFRSLATIASRAGLCLSNKGAAA